MSWKILEDARELVNSPRRPGPRARVGKTERSTAKRASAASKGRRGGRALSTGLTTGGC